MSNDPWREPDYYNKSVGRQRRKPSFRLLRSLLKAVALVFVFFVGLPFIVGPVDSKKPEVSIPSAVKSQKVVPTAEFKTVKVADKSVNEYTINRDQYVTATSLNVRSAPGSGQIVGNLTHGDKIYLYKVVDGWAMLGRDKWVSTDYLSVEKPIKSSGKPSQISTKDKLSTDLRELAWIGRGKDMVRGRLKDSQSAEFRNVFFHRGSKNIPVTCGEVNSKNSFGGYSGFEYFISAGKSDLTFLESEVSDFSNLWNQFCE